MLSSKVSGMPPVLEEPASPEPQRQGWEFEEKVLSVQALEQEAGADVKPVEEAEKSKNILAVALPQNSEVSNLNCSLQFSFSPSLLLQ